MRFIVLNLKFSYLCLFLKVRENLTLTTCTGVISKVLPLSTKRITGFNVPAYKQIQKSAGSKSAKAKK
jgi:hypothetical protein